MIRAVFLSTFIFTMMNAYTASAEQKSNVGNPAAVGENIQRIKENQAKDRNLNDQYDKLVPNKDRPQEKK